MGKITDHGRIRLKERTNITRPKLSHINKILKNGKSSEDYKDEFKKYLEKKGIGGAKVKVYDNQIYIFSRNTKRLITTYPIPERFIPINNYEFKSKKSILIGKARYLYGKPITICFQDKRKHDLRGYITNIFIDNNNKKIVLVDYQGNEHLILLKSIKDIDLSDL